VTSVITEADRLVGAPAPFDVLFGQDDGATRIWMIRMAPGPDLRVGLHRHEGDEIWRVRRGGIRITVGGQRLECGAGQLVVIPPNTIHGVAVIDDDTEVEAIGEIGMGEWITVIDAEGRRREVEVHVPFVPWHRRVPDGAAPTDLDDMIAMLHSTAHLL
jgi:mannose-6-phosphate isomerase-like protein (cupin superfamily)